MKVGDFFGNRYRESVTPGSREWIRAVKERRRSRECNQERETSETVKKKVLEIFFANIMSGVFFAVLWCIVLSSSVEEILSSLSDEIFRSSNFPSPSISRSAFLASEDFVYLTRLPAPVPLLTVARTVRSFFDRPCLEELVVSPEEYASVLGSVDVQVQSADPEFVSFLTPFLALKGVVYRDELAYVLHDLRRNCQTLLVRAYPGALDEVLEQRHSVSVSELFDWWTSSSFLDAQKYKLGVKSVISDPQKIQQLVSFQLQHGNLDRSLLSPDAPVLYEAPDTVDWPSGWYPPSPRPAQV